VKREARRSSSSPHPFNSITSWPVVRNANLLAGAICWSVVGLLWVLVDVVSSLGLGALGVALPIVSLGFASFWLVSWGRATLKVDREGVTITDIGSERRFTWVEIARFEILDWSHRTRLRVRFFFPRADQARVILKDGSGVRIRAVQPYHTWAIYTMWRSSNADRVVGRLNEFQTQFNTRARD
jgi:hypothetical protein